jgi:hypothetical protein
MEWKDIFKAGNNRILPPIYNCTSAPIDEVSGLGYETEISCFDRGEGETERIYYLNIAVSD